MLLKSYNGQPIPGTDQVFRLNWAAYGVGKAQPAGEGEGESERHAAAAAALPRVPPLLPCCCCPCRCPCRCRSRMQGVAGRWGAARS